VVSLLLLLLISCSFLLLLLLPLLLPLLLLLLLLAAPSPPPPPMLLLALVPSRSNITCDTSRARMRVRGATVRGFVTMSSTAFSEVSREKTESMLYRDTHAHPRGRSE
jgi:hypothetical protein